MRAGEPLMWGDSRYAFVNLLTYISEFGDIATWSLGTLFKSGKWEEPLPDVLKVDGNFRDKYCGIPFLYEWRLNALDIASLGTATVAGLAARSALAAARVLGSEVILAWLASVGLSRITLPRDEDEVPDAGNNPLFYLSISRIMEQGYKSYYEEDGCYVFTR